MTGTTCIGSSNTSRNWFALKNPGLWINLITIVKSISFVTTPLEVTGFDSGGQGNVRIAPGKRRNIGPLVGTDLSFTARRHRFADTKHFFVDAESRSWNITIFGV